VIQKNRPLAAHHVTGRKPEPIVNDHITGLCHDKKVITNPITGDPCRIVEVNTI
jgi:hypothetical protein